MAATLLEIARRYVVEGLEEADVAVLRRLVHDNVVRRGPMGTVSGIAALEEQVLDDRFGDICIIIEDVITAGHQAVIRYTWHAIHRGELFGIAPTFRRLELDAIEVLRVDTGRIRDADVYFDVYALFEQLGMLPRPHQLAPPRVSKPALRLVR